MGKIKKKIQGMPFKKAFTAMVLAMALFVATLSAGSIAVCTYVRERLLARVEEVIPEHYETEKTENGVIIVDDDKAQILENGSIAILSKEYRLNHMSTFRRTVYYGATISLVLIPFILVVIGTLFCAMVFYRIKMQKAIQILSESAERITENDLDFTINYGNEDEMGMLCKAFEKMRETLLENNKKMWEMMNERRQLNASVSHDLRTPITIIKGYLEHLQRNFPRGKVSDEKLMATLSSLSESTFRLERYVDSVRDIHSLDDIVLKKENIMIPEMLQELVEDLNMLVQQSERELLVQYDVESCAAQIDLHILYRVLENLVNNALRYAKHSVRLTFELDKNTLSFKIEDDGRGFTNAELKSACTPFYKASGTDGHMGLGLAICQILCRKHGGGLSLSNGEDGGAVVNVWISVLG